MSEHKLENPQIEQFETSGKFRLDGGEWDVDNNVYLLVDGDKCIVVDPAHDAQAVIDHVGDRTVEAILLTHAHNDHCELAPELAEKWGVKVYLHEDDRMLWEESNGDAPFTPIDVEDPFWADWGVRLYHTPGHSPGCIVVEVPGQHALLSGDTLFNGGPGATGRKYSSFPTIIESLQSTVFILPHDLKVYPGHGDTTTVGAEAARIEEYIERGY